MLESCDALIAVRKYEQALDIASKMVAAEPGNARVYTVAARALMELGRDEDAVRAASQAVALAPHWAYCHRVLSVALRKSAGNKGGSVRAENAVEVARESVRLSPRDPEGYVALAEACAATGRQGEADTAVRRALEMRPNSASCWVSASFVAVKARNWRAAESAARMALALEPGNRAAANNLGVALRGRGKRTLGAVAFLDAARIDPRSPQARDNLESLGFAYLNELTALGLTVLLAPLLIFWPLFVAVSVAVRRFLFRDRERLRPRARKLGIHVATRSRYRRRFDKQNARAQKLIAAGSSPRQWSSLQGRQRCSSVFLVLTAIPLGLIALLVCAGAFSATPLGLGIGLFIAGVVTLVGCGLLLRVVVRRRRAL
jgi:Flp pilus assembly protein TadD